MSNETSKGLNAPQAGVQGVDPRAILLDTISTTLNRQGYWLPIEGRRAIADAVVASQEQLRVCAEEAEAERDEARAQAEARPRPEMFSDGGVNDLRELYATHHAITDSGGQLTPSVHRALDGLRGCWDLALRHEQQKSRPTA